MAPYLHHRESVIVLKYIFSKPKVGDVIIFKHPTPPHIYCKRISHIKEKKLYVLGDNSHQSVDSRNFGYISDKDVIGKVVFKI